MAQDRLPFRALDNGPTTNLSYLLETGHVLKALNSAQASTASTLSSFGFIGMLLSIVLCTVLIVLSLVVMILEQILGLFSTTKKSSNTFDSKKYPHTPQYLGKPDEKHFQSW